MAEAEGKNEENEGWPADDAAEATTTEGASGEEDKKATHLLQDAMGQGAKHDHEKWVSAHFVTEDDAARHLQQSARGFQARQKLNKVKAASKAHEQGDDDNAAPDEMADDDDFAEALTEGIVRGRINGGRTMIAQKDLLNKTAERAKFLCIGVLGPPELALGKGLIHGVSIKRKGTVNRGKENAEAVLILGYSRPDEMEHATVTVLLEGLRYAANALDPKPTRVWPLHDPDVNQEVREQMKKGCGRCQCLHHIVTTDQSEDIRLKAFGRHFGQVCSDYLRFQRFYGNSLWPVSILGLTFFIFEMTKLSPGSYRVAQFFFSFVVLGFAGYVTGKEPYAQSDIKTPNPLYKPDRPRMNSLYWTLFLGTLLLVVWFFMIVAMLFLMAYLFWLILNFGDCPTMNQEACDASVAHCASKGFGLEASWNGRAWTSKDCCTEGGIVYHEGWGAAMNCYRGNLPGCFGNEVCFGPGYKQGFIAGTLMEVIFGIVCTLIFALSFAMSNPMARLIAYKQNWKTMEAHQYVVFVQLVLYAFIFIDFAWMWAMALWWTPSWKNSRADTVPEDELEYCKEVFDGGLARVFKNGFAFRPYVYCTKHELSVNFRVKTYEFCLQGLMIAKLLERVAIKAMGTNLAYLMLRDYDRACTLIKPLWRLLILIFLVDCDPVGGPLFLLEHPRKADDDARYADGHGHHSSKKISDDEWEQKERSIDAPTIEDAYLEMRLKVAFAELKRYLRNLLTVPNRGTVPAVVISF
jgi:hypothetical protein